MYLHLGSASVVRTDTILGIFDLDTTTVSRHSRDYLNRAEKAGRIVNVSPYELPKSFVVCQEPKTNRSKKHSGLNTTNRHEHDSVSNIDNVLNEEVTVYLSQLSSATLLKRLESQGVGL